MIIAKDLNERGVPAGTKCRDGTKGAWTSCMLLGMIKNITYTGDILMQKTWTDRKFKRWANRGQKQQYCMDGHHAQIIDHKTYRLANETLTQRGKKKRTHEGSSVSAQPVPVKNTFIITVVEGEGKVFRAFSALYENI